MTSEPGHRFFQSLHQRVCHFNIEIRQNEWDMPMVLHDVYDRACHDDSKLKGLYRSELQAG